MQNIVALKKDQHSVVDIVFRSAKKVFFTLLLIITPNILFAPDKQVNNVVVKKTVAQSMDEKLKIHSISQQTYPNCYRYMQSILQQYPKHVTEILFVREAKQELQSYRTILMIPHAWILSLEQQDVLIEQNIQNYIKKYMQSSTSLVSDITWGKVSVGIIVSCLVVIARHVYKIEQKISRFDEQIKQLKLNPLVRLFKWFNPKLTPNPGP